MGSGVSAEEAEGTEEDRVVQTLRRFRLWIGRGAAEKRRNTPRTARRFHRRGAETPRNAKNKQRFLRWAIAVVGSGMSAEEAEGTEEDRVVQTLRRFRLWIGRGAAEKRRNTRRKPQGDSTAEAQRRRETQKTDRSAEEAEGTEEDRVVQTFRRLGLPFILVALTGFTSVTVARMLFK